MGQKKMQECENCEATAQTKQVARLHFPAAWQSHGGSADHCKHLARYYV